MKSKQKCYRVRVRAIIEKTFDVMAHDEEKAEDEAWESFDPHSGDFQERYDQEILSVERIPAKQYNKGVFDREYVDEPNRI